MVEVAEGKRSYVGLSGTTAVMGAGGEKAFLFDVTDGSLIGELLGPGGRITGNFGTSVGIDDSTAVVGAPTTNSVGVDAGAAYVFDVTTQTLSHSLFPDDLAIGDRFGYSVAIDGEHVVVGAPTDDDKGNKSGGAYVFNAQTGDQVFKLRPDDETEDAEFGSSVDVSGNLAIIGTWSENVVGDQSGSAYIFDVETGELVVKLLPGEPMRRDLFGFDVAIEGPYAAVSSIYDDTSGLNRGSVYVFNALTGRQLGEYFISEPTPSNAFGFAIDLGTTHLVAGTNSRNYYSVALPPVPEPSTLLIGATGIVACTTRRRREA